MKKNLLFWGNEAKCVILFMLLYFATTDKRKKTLSAAIRHALLSLSSFQDATLVLRESVRRGRQRGHLQFDLPGVAMARGQNWTFDDLAIPDVHDFLPHTAASPDAFRPAFKMAPARQRTGVSLVLGIPTVKRDHQVKLFLTRPLLLLLLIRLPSNFMLPFSFIVLLQ